MNSQDTTLSNKYQQKTDKAHILDNPDTYIGSIENVDTDMWILHEESNKIIEKNIKYIPGLFKLFDEGIVNCRDHVIRMQTAIQNKVEQSLPVSYIDISIQEDGTIIMINDGNGIDVAQHPEYKIWIPELIFGHLRTSTNYDKTEKKIVGGKNGFGFKLVLIWSTYGYIETVDHVRGLKYTQEFKNNLDEICKPTITKSKIKPYTKIVFKPDYQRLGLNGLTEDMISLLKK
jgi:DNA topoisomerase-2